MTRTQRAPATARSHTAAPPPLLTHCPHCGQPVDVQPILEAVLNRSEAVERDQPWFPWRELLVNFSSRVLPAGLGARSDQERRAQPGVVLSRPRVVGLLLATLVAGLIVAILWGAWLPGIEASRVAPAPTPDATSPVQADSAAAIIETLSGYNRAETEAAALLTIEPLLPYLDPTSPFAERRARQLAERRARAMPHHSVLVRWAVGAIDVRGTTATVVTQETWSNQEAGAAAAEQATVRVTYTLRQDQVTGRWLIVASEQMEL
jgi:hypothetical protein